jgi:tetratricopeptide (TPR) repeat protein
MQISIRMKVLSSIALVIMLSFTLCGISSAKEKDPTPVKDTIPKAAKVRNLIKEGRFEKASSLCEELGEEGNFLKAEIAYFKGDFDAAIKLYRIIPADSKFANDALKRRIFIRENKGEQLKEYAEAELFGEKGAFKKGIKRLKSIATDSTLLLVDDASFLIGEFLERDNKFKQAINEYRSLINKFPKSNLCPLAYVRIGEIYEIKLGNKEKAIETYKTFLLKYPKNAMAPFVRKRLDAL